jgi:hypothetical protein
MFVIRSQRGLWRWAAGFGLAVIACGTTASSIPRPVRFAEVRPIVTELGQRLPPPLSTLSDAEREAAWPQWIVAHDQEIRARLEQGDEDTIINWMLFGTSFTSRPRALLGAVEGDTSADPDLVLQKTIELINGRMDDLLNALAAPGTDERRLFARGLLQRKGLRFGSPAELQAVRDHLLKAVMRVANEQDTIDRDLAATTRSGDSIAEFVERSRLFRTRGLSLDTAFLPNYAIDQSLGEMKSRGLLKPGEVKRVAIIGPGLDFADKDVGFDFYPQQTVQPFAVLDALKRHGLAPAEAGSEIVILDISPRVFDHVKRAVARAAEGDGYAINLPLTRVTEWTPDVRRYWQTFGDQIGAPLETPAPPAITEQAETRGVRVAPAAVQRLSVMDLNVVTDRFDGQAFDLIIATNVFVYYDAFDQALALANVQAMLKPGAFLLANFAAPEVRALAIRPVETITTVYGRDRNQVESILDFMVWYQAPVN